MPYGTPANRPYTPAPSQSIRKTVPFTITDYVFTALFALVSLLYAFIGITEGMALGFTVSHIAFLAVFATYLIKAGKMTLLSGFSLFASAAASIPFTLYSGDNSLYLAAAVILASTVIFALSLFGLGVDSFGDIMRMAHAAVIAPLENLAVPVKSLFENSRKKSAIQVLLALAISFPFLVVIISLLTSYDAAFEGLIGYLGKLLGEILLKFVLAVALFLIIFTCTVIFKFKLFNDTNGSITDVPKQRFVKNLFAVTFLSVICLVYIAFLASQFAYIFNSFKGLLPAGFSFAEYARRGFFEAEAIAFINLGIMLFFTRFSQRKENGRITLPVKLFFLFISLFSVFLIVTAGLKMAMYIGSYGLTVKRLIPSIFMVASISMIIAFTVKVFAPTLKPVKYAVIFSLLLFTAMSLIGIDRTVASYNVNAYINGRLSSVDLTMLSQLDPDSTVPYIVKLAELKDNKDARTALAADEALNYVYYQKYYGGMDYETYFDALRKDSNIFRWTLMRSLSKKALGEHKVLGGIPEYRYFSPPYAYEDYYMPEGEITTDFGGWEDI